MKYLLHGLNIGFTIPRLDLREFLFILQVITSIYSYMKPINHQGHFPTDKDHSSNRSSWVEHHTFVPPVEHIPASFRLHGRYGIAYYFVFYCIKTYFRLLD